jgi:hypothetical protein
MSTAHFEIAIALTRSLTLNLGHSMISNQPPSIFRRPPLPAQSVALANLHGRRAATKKTRDEGHFRSEKSMLVARYWCKVIGKRNACFAVVLQLRRTSDALKQEEIEQRHRSYDVRLFHGESVAYIIVYPRNQFTETRFSPYNWHGGSSD